MSNFFSINKQNQGSIYRLFFSASHKKTIWEAIIFYVLQVLGMYAVIIVMSKILSGFLDNEVIRTNIRPILIAILVIYVIVIQVSLLHEKKLLYNKVYLSIVASFAVLTYFLGGLIGLLPIIYFAMLEGKRNNGD